MRIAGSYVLDAGRSEVWPRVVDPRSLVGLIPGCQHLEQESANEYRGLLVLGLPAVSGSFETHVRILEQMEPSACRLQGEISGPTGIVRGTASFRLNDLNGGTELEYEAEGIVTGALAKLPARFVEGVAKGLLKQGLARLGKELGS
jgi:carbon monoxide dehydrogenase subunit G